MTSLLVENIGNLVTLAPMVADRKKTRMQREDLGIIPNAWLHVAAGKVVSYGTMPVPKELRASVTTRIDAEQGLMLPGLIDAHTHPLFAGSRAHEFAQRLDGATYQDIAAQGGGIRYSIAQTRAASDADLLRLLQQRLQVFLGWGVTTVEVKSGYGQSAQEELRHLRILRQAQQMAKQTLRVTCLAFHAMPREYRSTVDFQREMLENLLPVVIDEKLADFVDAFIERGYFSPDDVQEFVLKAKAAGIGVRLHADEFSDSDGAGASARWDAASADHLQAASAAGIIAMARAGTTAVLLPGTSLFTAIPFTDARPFLVAGCPVALATDFNPGSCQIDNLPLIASLGAVHCHLTTAAAIAAVTIVPARSLGVGDDRGALTPGYSADFSLHRLADPDEWIADFGRHRPHQVWIHGKIASRLS